MSKYKRSDYDELCGKVLTFDEKSAYRDAGERWPQSINKQERKMLDEMFSSIGEHDYEGDVVKPNDLPSIKITIERITGMRLLRVYPFKGAGIVNLHTDSLADNDIFESSINFCLLLKLKPKSVATHSRAKVISPPEEYFYFACQSEANRTLTKVTQPDLMTLHMVPMSCGQLVMFNPRLTHGVMTSASYHMLCGILTNKDEELDDED